MFVGWNFFVCACAEVSLYINLYEYVDVYDELEVGFYVVCLNACIFNQRKMRLFLIH